MTEESENESVSGINSKFWKVGLTVIAVLLLFAGPTYVVYALSKVHLDYLAAFGTGFIVFIAGIVFLFYLIRKKIMVL